MLMVGFVVVSFVVEMVGQLWEPGSWLKFGSIFSAYDPQGLILMPPGSRPSALVCNGTLIGLGLVAYLGAAAVFSRRDIPAAL